MFQRTIVVTVIVLAAGIQDVWAATIVDVLCYYEQGTNANVGYTDPDKALDIGGVVSLGQWADDTNCGQGNPVGLMLGFSTSIPNGPGNDLKITGNPFIGWYEPGYVEVAQETFGIGATTDGWTDETFYLIEPGNYDALDDDPRVTPATINYSWHGTYGTYDDPEWNGAGNLYGYADVTPGSDLMDIDDAIDADGNYVYLSDVAYVRIRTVTDSAAGIFGYFTTEIDYVQAVPEPSTVALLAAALLSLAVFALRRRLGHIR